MLLCCRDRKGREQMALLLLENGPCYYYINSALSFLAEMAGDQMARILRTKRENTHAHIYT